MKYSALWLLVGVLAWTPMLAQASLFAVVYADTMNLTLLEAPNGINVLSYSWAVVVNTGDSPITSEEWTNAPSTYADSDDCLEIVGLTSSDPTPILPGEAIGRIISHRNGLLLEGLEEPEELRPDFFQQFMSLQLFKPEGTECAGTLQYEVEWGVAGEKVLLDFVINLQIGPPDIEFVSWKRAESSPDFSPIEASTFGGIKAMYR